MSLKSELNKKSYKKHIKSKTINNETQPASDNDGSDEERSKIRGELSAMSFEDLIKLKEKLGAKVYNDTVFGTKTVAERPEKKAYTRENKNRPREMSYKRPVQLLKNAESKVLDVGTSRDPRFDSNCGEFDVKKFKENFSFVSEIKEKELDELKRQLKESSDYKEIKKIKFLIQRMENQNLEQKKRKIREEVIDNEKQDIKRAKTASIMPYHSSNKERKARELVRQYNELKEAGKLDKHLEKRRKKIAARDRKKINIE